MDWDQLIETVPDEFEPEPLPVAVLRGTLVSFRPNPALGRVVHGLWAYDEHGYGPGVSFLPRLRQAPPIGQHLFKRIPTVAGLMYKTPLGHTFPSFLVAVRSVVTLHPYVLEGENTDTLHSEPYNFHRIPPQIIIERLWPKICK